jgi:hypothetical protein
MIDLDEYLDRIARIAREIELLPDLTAYILGRRHEAGDQTVIECVDFRLSMLSDVDRVKLNWLLELGFFRDGLPTDVRIAGYAFAADVAEEVLRLRMRTLCTPYRREDSLFVGAPALWGRRRDDELIDFTGLRQEHGSEVIGVPGGFGNIPCELDPQLVAWLARTYPKSPFFVRLSPDRFRQQRPPMLLVEEVIAPGRFDALMKFDMYPGQTEYGEYALQDGPLVIEKLQSYLDYHVAGIRRLEIRAERRKDMLTMMIEELPRSCRRLDDRPVHASRHPHAERHVRAQREALASRPGPQRVRR